MRVIAASWILWRRPRQQSSRDWRTQERRRAELTEELKGPSSAQQALNEKAQLRAFSLSSVGKGIA